jgi:hypothetical protein
MEREALLNKIVTVKVDDSEVVCKRVVDASPRFDQLNAYGTDHYYSDSRATPLTSESGNEVTGEADWEVSVPQRRMIWDACIDKHLLTSKLWMWLEGDNRECSLDSRHMGPVPAECVKGVVALRFWPVGKLGRLQ